MTERSPLQAATAIKLPTVSGQLLAGSRVLLGLEVADATHGQAHVHVYNGTSNQGTLVATALPPNGEHDTRWYGPNGIKCPNGIYVEVISGTPSGSLFYR